MTELNRLKQQISQCNLCEDFLPLGVNPVIQVSASAKILIAGQAPGLKVHQSNIPFNDASGDRLRDWMAVDKDIFYDESKIAILPMGFCYPGKGKSGDLPPRKECAPQWRANLLKELKHIQLTLVIGQYAAKWHLPELNHLNLTDIVRKSWSSTKNIMVLPHPSPRNFLWFKRNPWFEQAVLPELKHRMEIIRPS